MDEQKFHFELPGQSLWEEMLLCDSFTKERMLQVQAMELEPSDVVVASYPKTGTTLLQEVVWLIRNNGDTEKANQTRNIHRVPFMDYSARDSFEIFENLPYPRNMKTHLPWNFLPKTAREGKAKVVYIMRNPKDCLVSYYHFHRGQPVLGSFRGTWNQFFDYFEENDYILNFGNQFDHMKGYWDHKEDDNLYIVTYEDLLKTPHQTIASISEFLECKISEETVDKIVQATRFDTMKENPMTNMTHNVSEDPSIPAFMRKGQIGDWRNYFNKEQNRIMDEMERERLKGTDLTFVYDP